jgi:Ti-type conjugative transfer relaxase TraA
MSLYHLNVSSIGKSGRSSAVASAAYRSCSNLIQVIIDKETGLEVELNHNYSNKMGLAYSNIFAPDGVDNWCIDRNKLWQNVEERETRVNATFARDIKLALQKEFTLEENIQVLSEFVQEMFVSEGIIADTNIHIDNMNNPHAHIMLTTRHLVRSEDNDLVFGAKNRLLDSKAFLYLMRARWADINNKYFKIYDIDKSITHESYDTRGFAFINPTIHEGTSRHVDDFGYESGLERILLNKDIVAKNIDFIKENPGEIIKSLARSKSVFSKTDLAKELDSFINEIAFRGVSDHKVIDEVKLLVMASYDELYRDITSSDEIVKLCDHDINDNTIFTTKAQLSLEEEFLGNLNHLIDRGNHKLVINDSLKKKQTPLTFFEEILDYLDNKLQIKSPNKRVILSSEQDNAVKSILKGSDVSLLIGRAGTGKSTVMKPLVEHYQNAGYNVIGGAYSAVASINLGDSAGIRSYTLSKLQHDWDMRESLEKSGEEIRNLLPSLTKNDILIIDEMSMVDLKMMNYFVDKVRVSGSKVIFVGDDNQFSSIGIGGASDKLVEKLDNIVLSKVFRQKNDLDKEVTTHLARYEVDEAIKLLREDNRIVIGKGDIDTRASLINDYMSSIRGDDLSDHNHNKSTKTSVIIAYSNQEVKLLNQEIRSRLLDSGMIFTSKYETSGREFYSNSGTKKIALGERLVFTKNDKRFGVFNGSIGLVSGIIDDKRFVVRLLGDQGDEGSNSVSAKEIIIDTDKFSHYDYGYAITAYKSQGMTYDYVYVLIDKSVGYESFNVMATRHRYMVKFYVDDYLLTEAINRKFSCSYDTDLSNDRGQNYNNKEAAFFELVVRRDHSYFAHDYIDYEDKPEVKLIKSYLAARDNASDIYLELLECQSNELKNGKVVSLPSFFDLYKIKILSSIDDPLAEKELGIIIEKSTDLDKEDSVLAKIADKSALTINPKHYVCNIIKNIIRNHNQLQNNSDQDINISADKEISISNDQEVLFNERDTNQILSYTSSKRYTSGLWVDFLNAKDVREHYAKELIDNYASARKYISSSNINYATLLKHAKQSSIAFDFTQDQDKSPKPNYEIEKDLHNIISTHLELLVTYNVKSAKHIEEQARKLTCDNEERKINLSELATKIKETTDLLWQLESNKKAQGYFQDDFKHYLKKTYKTPVNDVLANFKEIKKEFGYESSLEKIQNDPQILGQLNGVGFGNILSITTSHREAMFNSQTLKIRMNNYEVSERETIDIISKIKATKTNLTDLTKQFKDLDSKIGLKIVQEKYLYKIQQASVTTRKFKAWIKSSEAENYILNCNQSLAEKFQLSEDKLSNIAHKESIDIESKLIKPSKTSAVINDADTATNTLNNKTGNIYVNQYSSSEIHSKLADRIIDLSYDLLPKLSNKKIEVNAHNIKCGSIIISLESGKKGLWYRFSNDSEKGNLFDLIRIANNYRDNKESIEYSKYYLGINDREKTFISRTAKEDTNSNKMISKITSKMISKTNDKIQEVAINTKESLKIINPVPGDAPNFNANKVFYYHLKDNTKKIENIYEYRNINDELTGYVVRIKELATGNKATLPVVYTENAIGLKSWRSRGFGENRSLYNEQVLKNSNKPVLIVEGEKTADAAKNLYPEVDVVTWSGGANGYNKTDWSVLEGKKVAILPDHDKPGIKAALGIKEILGSKVKHCNIIDIDKIGNFPDKWDLADRLPENVNAHHITGIVLSSSGVDDHIRIERASKEYIEMRRVELQEELKENTLDHSFADYIKEIDKNKELLKLEKILAKKTLKNEQFIKVEKAIVISMNASELYDQKYKASFDKLYQEKNNNSLEVHAHNLTNSLAKLHPDKTHQSLESIAKLALDHSHKYINEITTSNRANNNTNNIHDPKHHNLDNKNDPNHHNIDHNNDPNHHNLDNKNDHHHLIDKSCLVPIAMSLSNRIIEHDDNYHKDHKDHMSHMIHNTRDNHVIDNIKIDNIKIEFNQKMEHDMLNYTTSQQHQQSLQLQRSNQMTMDR